MGVFAKLVELGNAHPSGDRTIRTPASQGVRSRSLVSSLGQAIVVSDDDGGASPPKRVPEYPARPKNRSDKAPRPDGVRSTALSQSSSRTRSRRIRPVTAQERSCRPHLSPYRAPKLAECVAAPHGDSAWPGPQSRSPKATTRSVFAIAPLIPHKPCKREGHGVSCRRSSPAHPDLTVENPQRCLIGKPLTSRTLCEPACQKFRLLPRIAATKFCDSSSFPNKPLMETTGGGAGARSPRSPPRREPASARRPHHSCRGRRTRPRPRKRRDHLICDGSSL